MRLLAFAFTIVLVWTGPEFLLARYIDSKPPKLKVNTS